MMSADQWSAFILPSSASSSLASLPVFGRNRPADARLKRLCELNVIEQVRKVCTNETVQSGWRRNPPLAIHGWAYDIHDGLLRDLQPLVTKPAE